MYLAYLYRRVTLYFSGASHKMFLTKREDTLLLTRGVYATVDIYIIYKENKISSKNYSKLILKHITRLTRVKDDIL